LGTTDITTTAVMTEIGSNSNAVSELVGASGLNKYSYYAPGSLSVDTNKDIVLTPPAADFKLGDFRSYNHAATAPAVQADFTQGWGPSNSNFGFNISLKYEGLNINSFADPATHVTVKIYASASDRTAESNPKHTQYFAISFTSDTPLPGHTRQSATKPATTGWHTLAVTNLDYSWLSDPNTTAYCEMYMSDSSGNRKINFGTRANNYTTITFHKAQLPYIQAGSYLSTKPSGYTVVFPEIHTASTACAETDPIQMTWNDSGFTFYVKARGVYSSEQRILELTSCTVRFNINGSYQTIYTGALSYNQGTYITGTLTIGDGVWHYGDVGIVEIINEGYGTNYTTC
jgi:hypothetical protein